MARKVFFSFHYSRDIMRVSVVRNSWRFRPGHETQTFVDKAEWEQLKRIGTKAVENWIERQLVGTSVTVVLIGQDTASRKWVLHEIKRSHELGKGMLGIYIHRIKDPAKGTDIKGANPFAYWSVTRSGQTVPMSQLYPTYDWVGDDGYSNLTTWVERAAAAARR